MMRPKCDGWGPIMAPPLRWLPQLGNQIRILHLFYDAADVAFCWFPQWECLVLSQTVVLALHTRKLKTTSFYLWHVIFCQTVTLKWHWSSSISDTESGTYLKAIESVYSLGHRYCNRYGDVTGDSPLKQSQWSRVDMHIPIFSSLPAISLYP